MRKYPYRFEKSPKKKGTCPNCKHPQKYRFYEDNDGNRLDEKYGRCERINGCGHFCVPPVPKSLKTKDLVFQTYDNQTIVCPNSDWVDKFNKWSDNSMSNFHQYCLKSGIPEKHLKLHGVATDNHGKTVFILRSIEGRIVNAKWVTFAPDGHREREKDNEKGSAKSYSLKQPTDGKTRYVLCLYGEDLLDIKKERIAIIVESEKTKVIASFYYPEFDWISVGSCNGLSDDKISVLFGRKVIWLCDGDDAGRNNSSIRKLEAYKLNYEIIDLFPNETEGYDIADAIEEGLRPDILAGKRITVVSPVVKELLEPVVLSNPNIQYRADNSIWAKSRNNWEVVADNFHIFIKYSTEDENEQITWILELKILKREPIFIEVLHEDFCSAKRLKTICAGKRLSLKANETHLSEIHSLLFSTSFGMATKMSRFGFHRDSGTFFFANCALTADGILVEPDEFNIIQSREYCLSMPVTTVKMKKRFMLTKHTITFNDWFEIYAKAHTLDKSFLPACFYIMSLFRDIVVTHKGSSPIMYLKGSAGTGKSSIIRQLTCLFGFQQELINLKSKNTEAALVKLMGQSANVMLWMDEFFNGFEHEGLLQAAYDNAGYHKTPESSRSNTDTDSIDIHSTLALTSNFIPTNDIFFSRCVLIQVEGKDKTQEQKESFGQLSLLELEGLGCISVELLKYRPLIMANYSRAFKQLSESIGEQFKNESIPERLLSNMVQTVTCAYILQCHGKIAICESTDEGDILNEFVDMGVMYMRRQYQIQDESSILSEFFGILQMLYESYQIHENVHFRFEGEYLFLRMPSIYPIFKQRYRSVYYKDSPDKDSIIQEVLKMEQPRDAKEVVKTIRFKEDESNLKNVMGNPVTNSLSIKYDFYSSKFGLDFTNRLQKI
jgi:hypothetical protein